MLKKFLIAVGILAVLGIIGIVFVGNKIDSALKAKEPEFRQYLTMTVEEQNAYVEKNIDSFLQMMMQKADEKGQAAFDKIKNEPEIHEAAINFGRSIVAGFIMASEPIVKDMAEDVKAQIKAEADEIESRGDKYTKLLEKYGISNK